MKVCSPVPGGSNQPCSSLILSWKYRIYPALGRCPIKVSFRKQINVKPESTFPSRIYVCHKRFLNRWNYWIACNSISWTFWMCTFLIHTYLNEQTCKVSKQSFYDIRYESFASIQDFMTLIQSLFFILSIKTPGERWFSQIYQKQEVHLQTVLDSLAAFVKQWVCSIHNNAHDPLRIEVIMTKTVQRRENRSIHSPYLHFPHPHHQVYYELLHRKNCYLWSLRCVWISHPEAECKLLMCHDYMQLCTNSKIWQTSCDWIRCGYPHHMTQHLHDASNFREPDVIY